MSKLNTDNIYLLPDGRELIMRFAENVGYCLFDPRLGPAAAPVYGINDQGRILFWGKPTSWQIEDLTDTGRKAGGRVFRMELA